MDDLGSDLPWIVVAALAGLAMAWLAAIASGSLLRRAARNYHDQFTGEVTHGLRERLLFVDTARIFQATLLAGVLALALTIWLTGSVLHCAIVVVLFMSAPRLLMRQLARRRRERFGTQLPDALLQVASAMRAGASLPLALRQIADEAPAPCGQEFDLVLRELKLGTTLGGALASLERRVQIEDLRLMTAAIRIAGETGGNLAETLERLSETIRRKLAVEGKLHSLTAQGRLQGWVMIALPLLVGVALFGIEPEAMQPLIDTWQGWVVCGVITVLELLGLMMIRRIMDIDV